MKMMKIWQTVLMRDSMHLTHQVSLLNSFQAVCFYYRNVNGLEDYQSYHEQSAGRAGIGYTNDFTGNVVWSHLDVATEGGPMTTEIRHVYNSSEADTSSRMGYGWSSAASRS